MLLNIPEELRNIPNWLVWKFENLDQPKPTKVPYDAKNGKLASVSRSETWSTFEQAVAAVPYCSGIGFVLTSDIAYTCIDLDYTEDFELQTKQRLIEEAFNSYSEISPSGKGLHIWVKGTVPSGRRRGPIEVYSTGRYMTMTGQTYRNNAIQAKPELLHQLWAEMETSSVTIDTTTDKDQLQDDGEIYEVAANAVNGEKFAALYSGDWEQFYPSQSEADFALVDMLAFYTQNRVQITRMFRNSKLGNRAKALRADYVNKMINRSFDRQLPAVDFDGLKNELEAKFAEAKQPKEPPKVQKAPKAVVLSSIPQHSYEPPKGLVGELAKFIYSAAPRPVVEIALAGSIGLMAGVCGRAYNISGMGLNQYVMLLANTGCHARGTKILMYDGSVKAVEDIAVGDLVMGPDSKSRNVLGLARGREQMARITPVKGESFVVNINHVLHLYKCKENNKNEPKSSNIGEIDITVGEYINKKDRFKHIHKLVRTHVMFNLVKELPLDPWFLGVMLGDGHFTGVPALTSADLEILERADAYVKSELGLTIRESQIEGNWAVQHIFSSTLFGSKRNELAERIKSLNLWETRSDSKFIPEIYKTGSMKTRLQILAGLIDTDGSLSKTGYDYITKSQLLANDVVFIARSLGLAAYINKCEKYSQNNTGGFYYRVSISGNTSIVPCVLKSKQAPVRQQKKNVLVTGFKVELLPEDDFYGFNLDKDHLYLTADFTIHHNSGKEAISSGIDKLMHEVVKTVPAAMEFIGPSEIASPQALIKYMSKTAACFTSLVGEFGLTLKQISSPKANPNQIGLRRAMLELYGKSGAGKIYKPMIYSDKEKNTSVINGPAFSIIGESTPERFYETLDDSMIYEGLLPRFTIMEYAGPRTELNPNHHQAVPDERLIEHFGALAAHCLNMNNGNRVEVVQQSAEAVLAFSDFNVKCDLEINRAHNEITRHLWNRAHVKALKLAAVLAVGENFIQPCVSHENARWAIALIENDVTNMLLKFENGDIGTPQAQNEQLKDIQKAFSKYLRGDWNSVEKYPGATGLSHHNKVVPQSFITGYCRSRASFKHDRLGPVQAIKTTIMSMMECGEVSELSVADKKALQLPVNGKCYMVHASVKWL